MTEELQPIVINLNVNQEQRLEETFMGQFASGVKLLLKYIFGDISVPVSVKGTANQVSAFTRALNREKNYMQSYMKYGLSDPKTFQSRHSLNRAVEGFEKETGIRWPFK